MSRSAVASPPWQSVQATARRWTLAASAVDSWPWQFDVQEDAATARRGIYFGDATARVKREWWFHRPSHLWFVIARDTASDHVIGIELASRTGATDGA